MKRFGAILLGACLLAAIAAIYWRPKKSPPAPETPPAARVPTAPAPSARDDGPPNPAELAPFPGEKFTWLRDALSGWCHESSESGEYRLPEIVCGGVVLFDFDGDGDLDVFLVNGGTWNDLTPSQPFPGHALFRNDGNMKFTDVALEAGVAGTPGSYCMGAAAADFDNDGDQDLYVTAFNGNFLYVNDGHGHFVERAAEAGVRGDGRWSTSAVFFDADNDGRLDLYVTNYVSFDFAANRKLKCGASITGMQDYCAPKEFTGEQDYFFHNEGGGKFRECALECGLKAVEPLSDNSKGLGAVASDLDGDGDLDLYVANDGCPNFLFINDGKGHFEECGAIRGAAYSEDGKALAGMGTDAGDVDGDGDMDLWCVNLALESNSLYVNDGKGWFSEESKSTGIAAADHGEVGFGTGFFDMDDDGDLDIMVANGHVLVNVHQTRGTLFYRQCDQLFENDGSGHFRVLPASEAGSSFNYRHAGRGLAIGDLDGDGDLDVVVVARDEPAMLLRNNHVESRGLDGHVESTKRSDAILLDLRGVKSNRDAVGAWLELTVGGKKHVAEVREGSSYCSRGDRRVHFGLGAAASAEKLDVRWPSGERQSVGPLDAGFEFRLVEGGQLEKVRELKK